MIRKMLMVAAAVAMPVGVIAATAGTASAKPVTDTVAGATATCTTSGGTIGFHYAIGVARPGRVRSPGQEQGAEDHDQRSGPVLHLVGGRGTFTGVASGKLASTNPGESAADFYSAASIEGNDPSAGGTLSGSLKVAWTAPPNQKFSSKDSVITIHSTVGGTTTIGGDTYGSFTIPGTTPSSISGAFGGSDSGASSTTFAPTAQDEAALTVEATGAGGISTITLGSGSAALQ